MRLYDNTTLSTFETCERKAFFRHVLHWTPEQPSPALCFGLAWHNAMDVVWQELTDGEESRAVAHHAYDAFIKRWVEEGMPHPESDFDWSELKARTPHTAVSMITDYIVQREATIRRMRLLGVEKPFIVPLDEGSQVLYCGKLDKIVENDQGMVVIIDHKTSSSYSKNEVFQDSFVESFDPNSQVTGYQYAGMMIYGDRFYSITIDAALVHKTQTGWKTIILRKDALGSFLDQWRWDTAERARQFEENVQAAKIHGLEYDYLPAFKRNTGSCWNYNAPCPYLEPCKAWSNPLRTAIDRYGPINVPGATAPTGFKVEPWSPFSEINLGELGIAEDQVDNLGATR